MKIPSKFDIILNIKGVHNFDLGLNEFSDLSREEFVAMMNGFRPRPEKKVRINSSFTVTSSGGS